MASRPPAGGGPGVGIAFYALTLEGLSPVAPVALLCLWSEEAAAASCARLHHPCWAGGGAQPTSPLCGVLSAAPGV